MEYRKMKRDIIGDIAELTESDPRLSEISKVLAGGSAHDAEPLYTFQKIAGMVGYDQSWLRRLGVHERCAIELAGGKRYYRSAVLDYLQSRDCKDRVAEIRKSRKLTKGTFGTNSLPGTASTFAAHAHKITPRLGSLDGTKRGVSTCSPEEWRNNDK
jgi:hypothetical protein